ncbi:MAG TPA: FHA domain-containing protein [Kofleriaceae bacterium]|nr:FHA domain-containing protein [Kofleriaceae bacterium]
MSNTRWWVAVAAMVCVGLAPLRTARAEGDPEVQFTVKPPNANDPKTKGDAPQIEATVIGGANLTPDKFSIVDKSAKPTPIELKATAKRNFNQGTETLAVAIVMLGWEMWIGNTSYRPEGDLTREKGVLIDLQAALDKLNFKDAGPAGSVGMVITYADTAVIRVPMGPLGSLSGSALGTQKDYKDTKGYELVKGVELALAELRKTQNPRKVLIVVTDGNDTNNDAAKAQLAVLKKQAQNDRVQTFAIVYKAADSEPNNVIIQMIQQTSTVTTPENIATSIQSILTRMADRQYLTFPGFNKETKLGLNWDGKPHDLVLKIDKDELEPQSVVLAPIWKYETGGGFPWWGVLLIVLALLLLVVIGVKVFAKKAPMPMPMPMPVAVAGPPPEAPKPLGPVKTVMIGQGGDEGGFPVVGWLVPLNGQHAYQTFRLRGGGTKIGTAPPSDIVINDGFMSTEHCQILCSPTGFSLVDPGSTNGCYVNDKRVQKHDLVDNDMITLGKTNFKFKSIV